MAAPGRLTEEQKRELIELLRAGQHRWSDLAERFGISAAAVRYHADHLGIPGPRTRARLDDENEVIPVREPAPESPGLRDLLKPQPWMDDALCAEVDPELWFPEKGGAVEPARAICQRCTVAAECLDYALTNNERFGMWGGVSERTRRTLTQPNSAA